MSIFKKLSIITNSSLLLLSYFMIAHILPIFNHQVAHADFQRSPRDTCIESQKTSDSIQNTIALSMPHHGSCFHGQKSVTIPIENAIKS